MRHHDFETERKAIFQHLSETFLARCDPSDGLIHSEKYAGKDVSIHTRAVGYDIRAMAEAATAWMMCGHEAKACQALDMVLDNQDLDEDSSTWGNFKWHSDWPMALDPNAAAFIVPNLWYLYQHAGEKLPASLRERIQAALRRAYDGIQAHCCTFLYTNIVLLNQASLLCIADVLDWPRPRQVVGWAFEEWRNRIGHLGVLPEYNSLTYSAVDIHALAIMLACPAPEGLHAEVRALLRLLIAQALADYHPVIGRITGAQSRAYPADRRQRGHSCMDAILRLVLPHSHGCEQHFLAWLGVPIGMEDILPEARQLPLPRHVRAWGGGQSRLNYLGADFALASINGRGHWTGHALPFFLAYASSNRRCGLPILPREAAKVEAHAADQQDGTLLGSCCWLKKRSGEDTTSNRNFSGLNTGTPDNLLDASFRPGFFLELDGPEGRLELFDGNGDPAPTGRVPGDILLIRTDTLLVGLRFLSPSGAPRLILAEDADGERALEAEGPGEALAINDLEAAVTLAFLLEVMPREAMPIRALGAALQAGSWAFRPAAVGWELSGRSPGGKALRVTIDAQPACFWDFPGSHLSANAWCHRLQSAT